MGLRKTLKDQDLGFQSFALQITSTNCQISTSLLLPHVSSQTGGIFPAKTRVTCEGVQRWENWSQYHYTTTVFTGALATWFISPSRFQVFNTSLLLQTRSRIFLIQCIVSKGHTSHSNLYAKSQQHGKCPIPTLEIRFVRLPSHSFPFCKFIGHGCLLLSKTQSVMQAPTHK